MAQGTITRTLGAASLKRVPVRYQLLAATLVFLAVAGYFAYSTLSATGTPRASAEAYLTALQRGDAASAWAMTAEPAPPSGVNAAALDKASLAAALSVERPSYPGLTFTSTAAAGNLTAVYFTYRSAGGPKQLEVVLGTDQTHKGVLGTARWLVHIQPVVVTAAVPAFVGGLSVDGRHLQIAPGTVVKVAVLPLGHRLTLEPAGPTAPATTDVDSSAGDQVATFKLALSPSGMEQASKEVSDAFLTCSASYTTGCPGAPSFGTVTRFEEVTTPTLTSVTYDNDRWDATGQYQAILTIRDPYGPGGRHIVSAGTWTGRVTINRSSLLLGSVDGPGDRASFAKPTFDESSARQLVASAFARCVSSASSAPADCPQRDNRAVGTASDFVWHLQGDPLAGSQIGFDAKTGVVQVTGRYTMSDEFRLEGSHFSNDLGFHSYTADLVVASTGLRLVNIHNS